VLDGYPLCDLPREKPLIPHEQDILADFVTILGGDPVLTNGSPLTTAQVIEIIHSRGGALAKFEDHHVTRHRRDRGEQCSPRARLPSRTVSR
jgi:hypothetical protein